MVNELRQDSVIRKLRNTFDGQPPTVVRSMSWSMERVAPTIISSWWWGCLIPTTCST